MFRLAFLGGYSLKKGIIFINIKLWSNNMFLRNSELLTISTSFRLCLKCKFHYYLLVKVQTVYLFTFDLEKRIQTFLGIHLRDSWSEPYQCRSQNKNFYCWQHCKQVTCVEFVMLCGICFLSFCTKITPERCL